MAPRQTLLLLGLPGLEQAEETPVPVELRRVADRAGARAAWAGRVDFTDFDGFDEPALIAETVRDGTGHHAVKSRAGVPLRAAFLAAATDPALAHPLRVVGRAGAGTDHVELAAAARHGVAVTHTPGSNANAVADPASSTGPGTVGRTRTGDPAGKPGADPACPAAPRHRRPTVEERALLRPASGPAAPPVAAGPRRAARAAGRRRRPSVGVARADAQADGATK
ncbi:hypothetical protein [Kitasatospora herbaricolor]|uniref:D-isomer specific 2-hydroxyacid dehydrogenase catalytic domain-containing protein n=1 Tax=Kitasatospora herbaricolor TaxID=68217 RepID=A0ABZ1W1E7_9ACTN|nr:hypothetical protein [Kitasatospora herbaricolor]